MSDRTDGHIEQTKKLFLEAFREMGIIKSAAKVAGVARSTVYRWQEMDDEFAASFREAEIEATETMEAEAFRRAVLGVDKPIYHQGVKVDTIKDYSDVLLIFTLKARAPEKYRERVQMQHADADGKRLPLGAVEEYVRDALSGR